MLQSYVLAQGGFGDLWSLILNSGPVALVVLLILLAFSIFSWAIMIRKIRHLQQVRAESAGFYRDFSESESLSSLYRRSEEYPHSPLAGIFRHAYRELSQQMENRQEGEPAVLKSLAGLERSMRQAAAAEMRSLEISLPWLATTGAVTPFIGLFGTVIGIINAFQGLGAGAATTIQAVAPGISEALVATAAGLFAAIPAVIGYNHFLGELKTLGAEMDDFSTELLNLAERSFT